MTSLFTGIFGGGTTEASRESVASQERANLATEAFIREQSGLARADVQRIFPEAQAVRGAGFQNALELIAAGVAPEAAAFTQGNIGAQNILAQTPGQVRNALLGLGTTDFQVTPFNVDTSFLEGLRVADAPELLEVGGTSPSPPPPPPIPGRPGRRANIFDNIGSIFSGGGRDAFQDGFQDFGFEPSDAEIEALIMRSIAARGGDPETGRIPSAETTAASFERSRPFLSSNFDRSFVPASAGVRPDIFGTPVRLPTPTALPPNILAALSGGGAPTIRRNIF